jgi:murein DD-endopeptidase MepM/ murein hydrolase activator NlpD
MIPLSKIRPVNHLTRALHYSSRKTRIVAATAIVFAALAFGAAGVVPMAPDASQLPTKLISQPLELPDLDDQLDAFEETQQNFVREEKIRPGDTLASLLNRLGVVDPAALLFINSDRIARGILQLEIGKPIQVQASENGSLQRLSASFNDGRNTSARTLMIERDGDHFKSSQTTAALEKRVEMHAGVIRSSLFAATDTAQIPDGVAKQIIDMFSTDIDFASDLKRGDRFNIVYETFWQNGEMVKTGRILAGEFLNGGNSYRSVWFEEPGNRGGGGYYSTDGKSLKKGFLKSPLEFTRISSGFSMRLHPISGKWKRHEGIDLAAPTGTPIRAAGDGEIEFLGRQNGYGNMVAIKHWSNYSTAYAHMSRFGRGLHQGIKVRQGDIIGYVGTTGWSTGPHLHYEFRVNNQPHDPLTMNVVSAEPLTVAEHRRFQIVASEMMHRFALLTPVNDIKLAAR